MEKKKHPNLFIGTPEIHIEGSIITEIPTSEELDRFNFSNESITVLGLYNNVAFPGMPAPLHIEDERLIDIAEKAFKNKECLLLGMLKDPSSEGSSKKEYHPVGVVCKVAKVVRMPNLTPLVFIMPGPRAEIAKITNRKFPYHASIKLVPPLDMTGNSANIDYLIEEIRQKLGKLASFGPDDNLNNVLEAAGRMADDIERSVYFLATNTPIDYSFRVKMLEADNVETLLEIYLSALDMAVQKFEIHAQIHMRTHQDLNDQQKKMFLQQQMKAIREELGEENDQSDENELRARAKEKKWSKEAANHFEKELAKLWRFNPNSPEYAIQYSYIDTLLNLPWNSYTNDNFSLEKVEKILDRDHYGLEQVKERIIEQMAVIKLRNDLKAPIICLYGPPGVGKTSLGKSIADALGRKYARVSFGGLHDEAEIRGHRRTYIGAMPGRIISALSKCGSGNPVFVLDEIDKIGKDFKGDPSTALLEVLDPEQNSKFHDNYIDFDYDLSKILFIATANSLSEISRPLLDRMEIIEIGGYIPEEKIEIAKRHLVPKCLKEHGFSENELQFSKDSLNFIITRYTRESGVRQLEKKISKVLRKIARLKASEKEFPKKIDSKIVREYLGKEEVNPDLYENNNFAGVVTGLAWTQVGGEILFIESSLTPGNGEKLTLTGNLGDVMKESATIALQYIKAHAKKIGINPEVFTKTNVHIHVPEGAIPKDGPSAGITMATSLASSFSGRKVRDKLAMTGEITLRGKVLPVGGIKEKILAAKRAGITDIILSSENEKDINEINSRYLKGLDFHYVNTVEEVLDYALLPDLAENRFDI